MPSRIGEKCLEKARLEKTFLLRPMSNCTSNAITNLDDHRSKSTVVQQNPLHTKISLLYYCTDYLQKYWILFYIFALATDLVDLQKSSPFLTDVQEYNLDHLSGKDVLPNQFQELLRKEQS